MKSTVLYTATMKEDKRLLKKSWSKETRGDEEKPCVILKTYNSEGIFCFGHLLSKKTFSIGAGVGGNG